MWFGEVKFDLYIYAYMKADDSRISFMSWLPRKMLEDSKTNGLAELVKFPEGNSSWYISPKHMLPITSLLIF